MSEGDTDELMGALAALLEHVDELDALVRTTARGATSQVDELRGVVATLAKRVDALQTPTAAPVVGPPATDQDPDPEPAPAAWVDIATVAQWDELAGWMDWLHRTYDLPLKLRVRPCWPAHRGVAEELAALRTSWQAAAFAERQRRGEKNQDGAGDDMASWHERHLHPCMDRLAHRYTIANCTDRHVTAPPVRPTDDALLAQARDAAPSPPVDAGADADGT